MEQLNNPPAGEAGETMELRKKPWYKKWWVWFLVGLGLVILLLVIGFLNAVGEISKEITAGNIDPNAFAGQKTQGDFEPRTHADATINVATRDDPYSGPIDAGVVVVEFGDFQCPFCRQVFPTVRELSQQYQGQVKFIYRDFPISTVHPEAQLAAEAAQCAHDQGGFWAYHDKLFINQHDLSRTALINYAQQIGLDPNALGNCLNSGKYQSEVLSDLQDGLVAGVQGTPTFFINNIKYEGVLPLNTFEQLIKQAIEDN